VENKKNNKGTYKKLELSNQEKLTKCYNNKPVNVNATMAFDIDMSATCKNGAKTQTMYIKHFNVKNIY
jgi:hypothetical protein